jgi:hypothetical protein
LILRRQARFALLVISDSAPVSAIDVDLLECGLEIERGIRIFVRKRDLDSRKPLPDRAWIELESVSRWPSADTAEGNEWLK